MLGLKFDFDELLQSLSAKSTPYTVLHLRSIEPTLLHFTVSYLPQQKSKKYRIHCEPHQTNLYLTTISNNLQSFPIRKVTLGE